MDPNTASRKANARPTSVPSKSATLFFKSTCFLVIALHKILQKNGTQWKERPLPPATEWTALSPGDPFQALMENQPLTLVIVNPLYYETLHIPPNFMKEISPLIKKVEDS